MMESQSYESHIKEVFSLIIQTNTQLESQFANITDKWDLSDFRKFIGDILIQSKTASTEVCYHMNEILKHELRCKSIVKASDLPRHYAEGKIGLWKGDITVLEIDCIVNAANGAMLGCFQPSHKCIDNVIHRAAGPRLRKECIEIMKGETDPPGTARLTKAYSLPSKYVAHTCGPQVRNHRNLPSSQLESCYTSVLTACAQKEDIQSIAFCCISTGLFGYPNEPAADVAVRIVSSFILDNPDAFDFIIFDTFLPKDYVIYRKILDGTLLSS